MKLSRSTKPVLTGTFALALVGGCALAAPAAATAEETAPAPKNVIIMIGDGMGYNHIDLMNAEDTGEVHWQVQRGGDNKVNHSGHNTTPADGWQAWQHLGMSTNWIDGPAYDPAQSWTDFEWNKQSPTDSAAAGTAMATGHKTYNGGLGVDADGAELENLSQRAHELGKSAGVVSSVPYSHATPAAFSAHNETRNNYQEIAHEQITGDLEVVMGAGHPFYSDDNEPVAEGDFSYVSEADWSAVSNGVTDREFIETNEGFAALTSGETPEKVFGVPQVASTLQQARSEGAPLNDVTDLPTMTAGALNVLDNNAEGFSLMVEGGAIDWTGHANDSERNLEETRDFDDAVDTAIEWIEENSSWDETLMIVTADHETGYLYGHLEGDFSPIVPGGAEEQETAGAEDETEPARDETAEESEPQVEDADELTGAKAADATEPEVQLPSGEETTGATDEAASDAAIAATATADAEVQPLATEVDGVSAAHTWNSDNHTNMLVPFFYKGAGAEQVTALGTDLDYVRGHYLDNTSLPSWLLNEAWVVDDAEQPDEPEVPGEDDGTDGEQDDQRDDQQDDQRDDQQDDQRDDQQDDQRDDQQEEAVSDDEDDASTGADAAASDGELAVTGAESPVLPIALGAAALLLGGGALTVAHLRRRAAQD
ncbi:alkaline phosphatase [Microbacterium halophytorum]|uniref:alkaline phosphatase n=1 Tax=Microbacterium halophytorum TaxID=2067568 RepID=UPI001319E24E|nr:alkaline phosphatase [Microbacterium halophytorum]